MKKITKISLFLSIFNFYYIHTFASDIVFNNIDVNQTSSANQVLSKNNIFLSPHFDDILLTFGGMLNTFHNELITKHNNVIVFFSKSNWTGNQNNLFSNNRIVTVSIQRQKEDLQVNDILFGGPLNYRYQTAGLFEAPLRKYKGQKTAGGGPGGDYSTFGDAEKMTFNDVYNYVKPLLQTPNCSVFLLSAIGNHIDHFIVREATIKAAHDLGDQFSCKLYFGEDEPYVGAHLDASNKQIVALIKRLNLKPVSITIDSQYKTKQFSEYYYSQYEDNYIPDTLQRIKYLHGHELIYVGTNFKDVHTDPSCKEVYCMY